jgi:hypothetical protein
MGMLVGNVTCRISRFQDGGSFTLNLLVTTGRLIILSRIVTNQIRRNKQIALECALYYGKIINFYVRNILTLKSEIYSLFNGNLIKIRCLLYFLNY